MSRTQKSRDLPVRYSVLFVDDEEQAQKYFRKAYEADFDVLTASSVHDAIVMLDEHHDHIGILVTDQRMPGKTGTDLLQYALSHYPEIVRILTTAYSDLDSAIEAVNTGAIFQYVAKPWNVRELRGILLRAMDHFQIQHERDALLCEKLSVLQQMLLLDRARVLCVLGASLEGRLRFPLHAVYDYLSFVMRIAETTPNPIAAGWEDMCLSNISESETAVAMAQHLVEYTSPVGFSSLPVSTLIPTGTTPPIRVHSTLKDNSRLVADRLLLPRLVDTLLRLAVELWSGQALTLTIAHADADHVSVTATTADAHAASDATIHQLLHIVQQNRLEPHGAWLDLLACHLLASHHGGRIEMPLSQTGGVATLILHLPLNAETSTKPPLPPEWLETLLISYDA